MHPRSAEIISSLPYSHPFLFVDELIEIDQNGVAGIFTFKSNSFFYEGHFKDHPVTPGVILTECMAQIGVVCLGIFLFSSEGKIVENYSFQIGLSSSEVDFYKSVFPGETVRVISQKEYFRFNKLKCSVEMFNVKGDLICRGKIAGMIKF